MQMQNTHNSNSFNPFGQFQNVGASGIGSNLGTDGSGQVSSVNTNQQGFQNAQGSGQDNTAQGQ